MVGIGTMGLNVLLSLVLIRVFDLMGWMALGGLALSNSLATTVEMIVLLILIRRRLQGLEGQRAASSLVRIGLASALMGLVASSLAWMLADQSIWLAAGSAVIVGLVVYVGTSLFLGTPEPRALWHMLASRGGASPRARR